MSDQVFKELFPQTTKCEPQMKGDKFYIIREPLNGWSGLKILPLQSRQQCGRMVGRVALSVDSHKFELNMDELRALEFYIRTMAEKFEQEDATHREEQERIKSDFLSHHLKLEESEKIPCEFCGDSISQDSTTSYCSQECLHYDSIAQ